MTTPRARELGIQGLSGFVRRFIEPATVVELNVLNPAPGSAHSVRPPWQAR